MLCHCNVCRKASACYSAVDISTAARGHERLTGQSEQQRAGSGPEAAGVERDLLRCPVILLLYTAPRRPLSGPARAFRALLLQQAFL